MFLLVFGHVDGGEELAAAVEQFGQLHHGFGFTHTTGAGQQEGAEPWFTNVALSVMADEEERPAARYGSGLEIAVSDYAGLEPDAESLSPDRPDLAALIAADETRPLALRIAAAGLAAEAGELPGETHRALYRQLVTGEDFEPSNAVEAAFVVLAKEAEEARLRRFIQDELAELILLRLETLLPPAS